MELGLWEVLSLLGVAQGVFLGSVLWTHSRGNRRANRLLSSLVVLFSLHLLHIALYWSHALERAPHLWGTAWFLPYLYGPLLYLYTVTLLEPEIELGRADVLHFLPFFLCTVAFSRFYLLSADRKRSLLEMSYGSTGGASNSLMLAVWGLQFVHFVLYAFASLRRLRSTPGDSLRSRWLLRLLAAFAASFCCWFLYGFAVSFGLPYSRGIDVAATLAMTVSIYAIGYAALRAPELFVGDVGRLGRGKYEGSALTDELIGKYRQRLVAVMESARPHVDASLRLSDLANLVEMPPHQLSQVLNQGFGQRFTDFVNRYRVEEAKRLLLDPARAEESLLSLAYEAGFNNKTSFNQAFKKHTRTTPSRYRAEVSRQLL